MSRPRKKDLLLIMEEAVIKIMRDPKSTVEDRMTAIKIGADIARTKHKVAEGDEAENFFKGTKTSKA